MNSYDLKFMSLNYVMAAAFEEVFQSNVAIA
jgi:hypothetical protein